MEIICLLKFHIFYWVYLTSTRKNRFNTSLKSNKNTILKNTLNTVLTPFLAFEEFFGRPFLGVLTRVSIVELINARYQTRALARRSKQINK
ncbi:hypothetical protein BpHYR1_032902 [Brachionus plicatilis]|uniref:Uncharacterized protein n=1 Tax=Brachionus plicatilis TaxID=10195 RepID=A0A3M7P327_BRAPC|nr:hypothetical protein BpHYR1_032902 [Brachionus plicatilis]